jgi:hypothetical protein
VTESLPSSIPQGSCFGRNSAHDGKHAEHEHQEGQRHVQLYKSYAAVLDKSALHIPLCLST